MNFNSSKYTTVLLIATALEVGVKKYSNPVDAVTPWPTSRVPR